MITHTGYVLIAILAAAAITGTIPAFAADELACPDCVEGGYDKLESYKKLLPIVIWTDKEAYDQKSTIVVSGHVRNPNPDMDVTLKVVGPTGNVVKVEQLTFDSNGDFETTLNTASPLWTQGGVYTITAQYGGASKTDRVQIEVGVAAVICGTDELQAKLGNKGYCIPYSITGGRVTGIEADVESATLLVSIETTSDSGGELTITLPRAFMGATIEGGPDGEDDDFFVIIDGEEAEITNEETTSTDRTLTIPFPPEATEIEIIGTYIIPEFGPIAALVLAVAIISIIVVSAKTRLRLIPKF